MSQQKFGLLGQRLDYSFSKDFFHDKFKHEGIDATYQNIELANINELKQWFEEESIHYRGVNVTTPYKEKVIPFLDELNIEAKEIGAVNTILFKNGKKIGYNTDAFGFQQSIKPFFKGTHERALILGTGGASKAIAYVLRNLGVTVAFLSRNPNQDEMIYSYDMANQIMVDAFKMIVNCTPIGTFPNVDESPDFPIDLVSDEHFVVDLIYNPTETKFLKIAREKGAITQSGLSMLKHQALKSWEIWNKEK